MPAPKDPEKRKQWLLNVKAGMEAGKTMAQANGEAWGIQKGRKQSKEEIKKRTKALRKACRTKEYRAKLSKIAKENGYGKWMKGKKAPGVSKANRRRKGKSYKELYGDRWKEEAKKRRDSNRERWVGRHRKQRDKHNGDARYKRWRTRVFKRDNWTCQYCGATSCELNAHHIKSWAKYPAVRYELDNGVTFCVPCHKEEHERLNRLARRKRDVA